MLSSVSPKDIAITAGAAATLALLIRWFVIGVFVIPSHSMDNTLMAGDHIVVSKLKMAIGSVNRGDVVVFNLPDSLRGTAPDEPFIKRVIAVEGDSVQLTRLGITVNGRLFPDPPLSAATSPVEDGHIEYRVPGGHVFVMGDNRSNSWDSRYWGFLPIEEIIGAPLFVYWSSGPTTTDTSDHVRWNRIFNGVQ